MLFSTDELLRLAGHLQVAAEAYRQDADKFGGRLSTRSSYLDQAQAADELSRRCLQARKGREAALARLRTERKRPERDQR